MKFLRRFAISAALVFSIHGQAREAAQLLQSPARPTMDDFLAAHNPLPPANPYPYAQYAVYGDQLTAYHGHLANVIAQLEKAYPGAVYVGVGRDSALLADALNAFYISVGQRNRVRRLDASSQTFMGANDQTIFEFLKSSGIDPKAALRGRGIVLFDGTRYNNGSQSRRIMNALYAHAVNEGISPNQLVRKLNFVSTAFDGFRYYPRNLIKSTNLDQYFRTQEAVASAAGPSEILSVDAWVLTHGYEWHGPFGALMRENGRVFAQPGPFNAGHAPYILAYMYEVGKIASSPEFLEKVKAEARNLGFEFNAGVAAQKPAAAAPVPPPPPAIRLEPVSINFLGELNSFNHLPWMDNSAPYVEDGDFKLTENGWSFLRWINTQGNIAAQGSGWIAAKALRLHNEGKLRDRETRRLIRYILDRRLTPGSLLPLAAHLNRNAGDQEYFFTKVQKANEDFVIQENIAVLRDLQQNHDCQRLLNPR